MSLASQDKIYLIDQIIKKRPQEINLLNNKELVEKILKSFKENQDIAMTVKINLLNNIMKAHDKSWYSNLNSSKLEQEFHKVQAEFSEHTQTRSDILYNKGDISESLKKIAKKAVLENDKALNEKSITPQQEISNRPQNPRNRS